MKLPIPTVTTEKAVTIPSIPPYIKDLIYYPAVECYS